MTLSQMERFMYTCGLMDLQWLGHAPSRPRPVPLEDTSPLWGSRGRVATRPGSQNRARERRQGRRGVGEKEVNKGPIGPIRPSPVVAER